MPHIAELLFRHKSFELPGIGRFLLSYSPARLESSEGFIFPPKEEILFDESTEGTISNLVRYLSLKEHISEPQANAELEKSILRIKLSLAEGYLVALPEIGSLKRNMEGKTEFFPIRKNPVWERVSAIPLDRPQPALSKEESPFAITDIPRHQALPGLTREHLPQRWWWVLTMLVFGLLIAMVLILRECAVSNKPPVASSRSQILHPSPTPPPLPLEAKTNPIRKTLVTSPIRDMDSLHYNIVFASFTDPDLARKKYHKIRNWGHPVVLLQSVEGKYLLAVPCYSASTDTAENLSV
ncbi:MAG TPA: hypothetical protein VMV20_04945, partial [Chitinophagaceae bacterium]|nr:hypothetical protein [Chitinophagaceae bacterium]